MGRRRTVREGWKADIRRGERPFAALSGAMGAIRHAWMGLFAAAFLVIACGSLSAATAAVPGIAANHSDCGDHPMKPGPMAGCATSCLAIAPVAPAAPPHARAMLAAYAPVPVMLTGTTGAPEPPPPRRA